MRWILFMAVFACLCLNAAGIEAAPGSRFSVPKAPVEEDLRRLMATGGPFHAEEGELEAVEPDSLILRTRERTSRYRLVHDCLLYADGKRASRSALRPVSPEARYWARIWHDDLSRVWAVEGVYRGGELMVIRSGPDWLEGVAPETNACLTLQMAPDYPHPAPIPGENVYVLLDFEGRVRWLRSLADPSS